MAAIQKQIEKKCHAYFFINLTIFKKSQDFLGPIMCYRRHMTVESKGCGVEGYAFKNLHQLLAIYLK